LSCVENYTGRPNFGRDRRSYGFGIGNNTAFSDKRSTIAYILYSPEKTKTLRLRYRVRTVTNAAGGCAFSGFVIHRLTVYTINPIDRLVELLSLLMMLNILLSLKE